MQLNSNTANQTDSKVIHILYGSQSGHSESIANDTAATAKSQGLLPVVKSMNEIEIGPFAQLEYVLIITSTYGEGEMPDNAQILWEAVSVENVIRITNMKYSVLALGDSSFDQFCQAGKDWDQRLAELGANRIFDRIDCNVDYEIRAEEWISKVIPLIAQGAAASAVVDSGDQPSKPAFTRKNPFPAKMRVNRLLTGAGSSKEIRHYEISLLGSGLSYEAGDALSIIPRNCPDLVAHIIKALACSGNEVVPVDGKLLELSEALRSHFEIKLPSKELVEEIAKRSGDQELNKLLKSGDKDTLADYLWGRDILDLLLQFPEMEFSTSEFLALLNPLQHRAYSISSSSKMYPESVHLTVASVRYHSHNRDHKGVCSTFLADLVDEETDVNIFFAPNKSFRVPLDNNRPMIMVGPGTGIAPFRAFLQEREFRKAEGKNWFFFGDRNAATDFIYKKELEEMLKKGVLTRLDLAFSRDQAEKIYVQDKMRENGKEMFSWLEQGGYFFVSGDAYHMAKDVDKALHDIISEHGRFSAVEANDYVNHLKKEKRYVRDIY